MRLLYSPALFRFVERARASEGVHIPAKTRALLSSIDPSLLGHEQTARAQQLKWQILRELPLLGRILDQPNFVARVASFIDSGDFWQGSGRSLAESFCLHCVRRREEPRTLVEELLELCGIISGLTIQPKAPSPWSSQKPSLSVPGSSATESMSARWRVVDGLSRLERGDEGSLESIVEPGPSLVLIGAFADGEVRALSLEV